LSLHRASVRWTLDGDFLKRRYDRRHVIDFGHGVTVPGSASPEVVRPPFATHEAVDPEAAFVASISACHMLWFLDCAVSVGVVVEAYEDEAEGVLARGADGRMMVTKVRLRPKIRLREPVSAEDLDALHHKAHELCFIANSVKTEIVVESVTA
jgi:organic hydroperoxide reductase OsmC/OhrA